MYSYSLTINPSPFKRWDKRFVSAMFDQKISALNYSKLPGQIQRELLLGMVTFLKNGSRGFDWGEPKFELTENHNWHLHVHFFTELDFEPMEWDKIKMLNDMFSSGKKYKALYSEKTQKVINYWQDYEEKDQWLNETFADMPPDSPISKADNVP